MATELENKIANFAIRHGLAWTILWGVAMCALIAGYHWVFAETMTGSMAAVACLLGFTLGSHVRAQLQDKARDAMVAILGSIVFSALTATNKDETD